MQPTLNHVNGGILLLSFAVALASCCAAMHLGRQTCQLQGADRRLALLIGAVQLGAGAWTVNAIGALAFDLLLSNSADISNIRVLLWPPVLAAALALHLVTRERAAPWAVLIAGLTLGAGISFTEYREIAATQPDKAHKAVSFLLPFAMSSALSTLALWVRFGQPQLMQTRTDLHRTITSGTLLALGFSSMDIADALTADWAHAVSHTDHANHAISLIAWALFGIMALVITLAVGFTALLRYRAISSKLGWAKALIDDSGDAIVSKTTGGIITSWNRGAEKTFGFTAEEAIGQPMLIAFPPGAEHEEEELIRRILAGETIRHYETVRRKKNGTMFHVSVNLSPILDNEGKIVGISKIARDISERLANEELKRAADKALMEADARTELMRSVSHELRTPIHWILGYLDTLADGRPDARTAESLQGIRDAAHSLQALVHTILDSVDSAKGQLDLSIRPHSVRPLLSSIDRAFGTVAAGKPIQWAVEIPQNGDLCCQCDPVRLEQVLRLLLDNAFKFTERGSVRLQVSEQDTELWFTVEDSGIGIPAEELPLVFEPLRQIDTAMNRKYAGLGLGCTLSKQLVSLMGGQLTLESTFGVGTTVRIRLPLAHVEPDVAPAEVVPAPQASTMRLLAVDDIAINRKLVSTLLGSHYEIDTADGGAMAVDMAQHGYYAAILMDVQMPDVDGLEATRRIRAWEHDTAARRTPIIALTANTRQEDRQAALDAGMDDFATKPINKTVLLAMLAAEIAKSGISPQ